MATQILKDFSGFSHHTSNGVLQSRPPLANTESKESYVAQSGLTWHASVEKRYPTRSRREHLTGTTDHAAPFSQMLHQATGPHARPSRSHERAYSLPAVRADAQAAELLQHVVRQPSRHRQAKPGKARTADFKFKIMKYFFLITKMYHFLLLFFLYFLFFSRTP